jgi:hypothetical protein
MFFFLKGVSMRNTCIICFIVLFAGSSFSQSPTIGGCPVFPGDNPWNIDISNYPVHPNSDGFINAISENKQYLHADFGSDTLYGIPYVVVDSTQPFVPITYSLYGDQSDPGPFPFPANAPIEGGWNAPTNSDRHVLVIDKSNCMLYEVWQGSKDQTGSGWTASNGAKFDLTKNEYRPDSWTSADAAGLPIFPGLVRYEEAAAGAINHAVRFTAHNSQKGWIHPARHEAGGNDTHYPPMGLRVRMKANYDISNVTGKSKIILQALKKYGMILADNGSSWFISGTSNLLWDDNDLNQLKKIPGSAFEVVYTGPIKTASSSIAITTPSAGATVTGGSTNYLIQCTTSGVDTLRTLEFSSDGGAHWYLVSGGRGTTTFTWSQVPNVATTQAMIRISDEMANTATSGLFTITSTSSATITNVTVAGVTNGHIPTGTHTTISWSSTGNMGPVLIAENSPDNLSWQTIDNSISSSKNSIPWIIPAPSPSMFVRIRSASDPTINGTFGSFTIDPASGVSGSERNAFSLSNYPNPVYGKTEISFTIPKSEFVSLKLYSVKGAEFTTLLSNELEAGQHTILFDTRLLPEGMYYYRLNADGNSASEKIIVTR